MTRTRRVAAFLAAGGLPATVALVEVPAHAATGNSMISVFHGIPGLNVDVYVNGAKLLTDFKPGTIIDRCRCRQVLTI